MCLALAALRARIERQNSANLQIAAVSNIQCYIASNCILAHARAAIVAAIDEIIEPARTGIDGHITVNNQPFDAGTANANRTAAPTATSGAAARDGDVDIAALTSAITRSKVKMPADCNCISIEEIDIDRRACSRSYVHRF